MTYQEEIAQHIKILFNLTQLSNVVDNRVHYKWELGGRVYHNLKSSLMIDNPYADPVEISTLYGYPIEINRMYPECIKLWKEVEP